MIQGSSTLPKVSVIVPVFNGEITIEECLNSLLNQEYPKNKIEIIVVDNNSTDRTKEIVSQFPVKYLFEPRPTSYAARNRGVKNAEGELIAFIDADCIAEKDWILNLIRPFSDNRIGGCGGRVQGFMPKTLIEKYCASHIFNARHMINGKGAFLPLILVGNSIYRKKVLQEAGGFDSSFISGGDNDITWQVISKGYKIKYVHSAVVYHKHRSKLFDFLIQFFKYGIGKAQLLNKYKFSIPSNIFWYFSEYQTLCIKLAKFFYWFFMGNNAEKRLFPFFDFLARLSSYAGRIYGVLNGHRISKS